MYKLLLLLAVSYQLLSINHVMAHFVKSDSEIGAVLHVDPGDDPKAGEESNIIFEFKDLNNKFNLTNCDCSIVIYKEGQEIFSERLAPVAPDQNLSSVTSFVFPEKNVYKIKVNGKSNENLYPEFMLEYDVRVAKEASVNEEPSRKAFSSSIFFLGGGIVIALFTIGIVIVKNRS
jgi:hypothetical protein